MVTVIRPSRARCVNGTITRHERAVLPARHPALAERLDFKRFVFGRAAGRVLINAGIGRMSAPGANRTRRDGGNDVNDPQPTCRGSPIRSAHRYASKRHRHFDARYRAPSDVLVLSRSVFSMRDRMEAISATARIHHTSCRRCPYWTVDGYRSDTQGLPPRYADRVRR